jgi:hypothetical protein
MVNAQVSFHFLGFHRRKKWREFPVLVGICRKCGWMNFHAALVLRQNSVRTENSALPWRDGCSIQVIPSPSSAKNLSRKNARAVYLYILGMQEPGRFRDAVGSD